MSRYSTLKEQLQSLTAQLELLALTSYSELCDLLMTSSFSRHEAIDCFCLMNRLGMLDDTIVESASGYFRDALERSSQKAYPAQVLKIIDVARESDPTTLKDTRRERYNDMKKAILSGRLALFDTIVVDYRCPKCGVHKPQPRRWISIQRAQELDCICCIQCANSMSDVRTGRPRVRVELPADRVCRLCGKEKTQRRQWPLATWEALCLPDDRLICKKCYRLQKGEL